MVDGRFIPFLGSTCLPHKTETMRISRLRILASGFSTKLFCYLPVFVTITSKPPIGDRERCGSRRLGTSMTIFIHESVTALRIRGQRVEMVNAIHKDEER